MATSPTTAPVAARLDAASLRAVSHAAASPSRFAVAGALLTTRRIIATDGWRLAMVPLPSDDADGPETTIGVVPRAALKAAARSAGAHGSVVVSAIGSALAIETDTATGKTTIGADAMDVDFPPWERVIPDGPPVAAVTLDATMLRDACDLIAKGTPDGKTTATAITLELRGTWEPGSRIPEHPPGARTQVVLRGRVGDDLRDAVIVIMPLRWS